MTVLDLWCWWGRHAWEFVGLAQFGRGRLEKCGNCKKSRRLPVTIEELDELLRAERRFQCQSCSYFVEAINQCPHCGAARR